MELSLVQIADKLSFAETEYHGLASVRKYRGIRFKKKEDYLFLYENGFDCIIKGNGEDEYLVLKNTYLNAAMNEVLDVFDLYEKWSEQLIKHCKKNDFDAMIDCSWNIFVNPLIIRDSGVKLLGISRNVDANNINNEYKHLLTYGYTSLSAYKHFAEVYKKQELSLLNRPIFLENSPTSGNPNMLCGIIRKEENVFGRVFIVEYHRKITECDYRNLQYMCSVISDYISVLEEEDDKKDILKRLLNRELVSEDEIEKMYAYWELNEHTILRILTISLKEKNPSQALLMLLNSYATQLFEKSLCVIYRNSIVILINEDIYDLNECLDRLKKSYLYINKETLLGVSLNFCGVKRLYEFYDQCVYAIKKGMEQNCEQRLYMFYFYGADYIVDSLSMEAKICAAMPEVKKVFYERNIDKTDLYYTLRSFVKGGFSVAAAAEELKVHKNTVSYRLEKFCRRKTRLVNLDDPYIREYMLISIRVLENNSRLITFDKYNKF